MSSDEKALKELIFESEYSSNAIDDAMAVKKEHEKLGRENFRMEASQKDGVKLWVVLKEEINKNI